MSFIAVIDKVIQKFLAIYRKELFRAKTNCGHRQFKILGPVYVLNPNLTIGRNVIIFPGVMFFGKGPIVIGDNTKIGNNTVIYSSPMGGVFIGSHVAIAADCYIIDADHGTKRGQLIEEQNMVVKKVVIGDNVWLGTHVVVVKGSVVNDGAVVGAMSLVNSEIKKESINVGIPAIYKKDKEVALCR